jgi:hypothetical protein
VVEVLPDVGEEEEFVAQHEAKQRHPAARCRGRNSTVAGPACVLSPSGRQS